MSSINIHYNVSPEHKNTLLRFEAALKSCSVSIFVCTHGLEWRLDTLTTSSVYFDLFTYVKEPALIAYFSERELSKMTETEFIAKLHEFSRKPPIQKQ